MEEEHLRIKYFPSVTGGMNISQIHGSVDWAPRSPDLKLMDFLSWGYLKSLFYEATVEYLKQRIQV
jgi:hypothetical protein